MGSDNFKGGPPDSIGNASSVGVEGEFNDVDSLEVQSSDSIATRDLRSAAEVLTRLELDLACLSEKLVNLDILVMHVASREGDFEAFSLAEEPSFDVVEKALEFDLLYGFLDCEVKEVEVFLSVLQCEIGNSRGVLSSSNQEGDAPKEVDKLQDCDKTLKQLFDQLSDIKAQSIIFHRILLASSGDENWKNDKELAGLEDGQLSGMNAKIKMQTAEQQRSILRMLEKSLARELDLEKSLNESRQTEEDLKLQAQREVFFMEEEAEDMWGRLFEAENSSEILLSLSRELYQQLQVSQFDLKGSVQREAELTSKMQDLSEQLKGKEAAVQYSESSQAELEKKVCSLEQKLRDFESLSQSVEKNEELKTKVAETEERAMNAETECERLRESNENLNNDLSQSKSHLADATERVEKLEKQLEESESKRFQAEASVDAGREREDMLRCMVNDMENLIKDLKAKLANFENQIDSAEEKCIVLSEANAELNEEIYFLRGKVEHLEKSLLQAYEAKKETAKDIRVRSKFIADLVMQLTLEREQLHKQMSSLMREKKAGTKHASKNANHDAEAKEHALSDNQKENGEEILASSTTSSKVENASDDSSQTVTDTEHENSMPDSSMVRNIDADQLKFKHAFLVLVLLSIPAFAAFLFRS